MRNQPTLGVTEIYHIQTLCRDISCVTVGCIAWNETYLCSTHQVGVYVHRINGVCNAYKSVSGEYIANVAGIALGTVIDKYVIGRKVYSQRLIITFHYGLTQPLITALGTVTVECVLCGTVFYGLMHGFYDSRSERTRHIAYSHTDDIGAGVGLAECIHPLGDIQEQVTLRKS